MQKEFKKGAAFVRHLVNQREMQRSAKPDEKPLTATIMAEFIFSDIGRSMWPRTDYFPQGEAPKNLPEYPRKDNADLWKVH